MGLFLRLHFWDWRVLSFYATFFFLRSTFFSVLGLDVGIILDHIRGFIWELVAVFLGLECAIILGHILGCFGLLLVVFLVWTVLSFFVTFWVPSEYFWGFF